MERIGLACQDHVRSFFPDHVHCADDEKPRNTWEYRGVYHTQALRAINTERGVNNAAGLSWADRATAGRMVPPGLIAHERSQVLI